MNANISTFNQKYLLTDYVLFDRNRSRKVAIYGRVSTEHEAQLSALENQMEWYDDQASRHSNWDVVKKYIDRGITGTQAKKRPNFLQMIEDAKHGDFDLIVTREVCRFARNVVDTLVVTRMLKGIGVEVYFIEDNIWTMDGDGELRLSLMATLAQEESRKISERVKAGQKISRDNHVLYGNGNILGYDRVGDTYVINEEQAETVKMIFSLYLEGKGSSKISNILTERKRRNASGIIKWPFSYITRVINNATYTGVIGYNKSRSNNFLEQKRINNLDRSTFEYVSGNFPAIISSDVWEKAQEIRESKVKKVTNKDGKETYSHRISTDVWLNKMRCACGASFCKYRWRTNKDGRKAFGYECRNQVNNGSKLVREKLGLDTDGFCDVKMVVDWKMDFMAKTLFDQVWKDRKSAILQAIDLLETYFKNHRAEKPKQEDEIIRQKIEKLQSKIKNLITMRTDDEITKAEYQEMRLPLDQQISELKEQLGKIGKEETSDLKFHFDEIRNSLEKGLEANGEEIDYRMLGKFVRQVIVKSNTEFEWYLNLSEHSVAKARITAEGRKNNCTINIEEIVQISSLHSLEIACEKGMIIATLLSLQHRQP